jgi:hypothetical protein
MFRTVPVLFRQVPHSVTLKSKPASLSPACDAGSSSGLAKNSDPFETSVRSGFFLNGIDDHYVEQRSSVGRQLVAGLAGLVHGFDGTARRQRIRTTLK